MRPNELQKEENRKFFTSLFNCIGADRYYVNHNSVKFNTEGELDLKIKYRYFKGDCVGNFIKPTFLVRDTMGEQGRRTKVLEIGGGVLQSSSSGKDPIDRLLQRLGIPRIEPENLHGIEYINPLYFMDESRARDFMESKGYNFSLNHMDELIRIRKVIRSN